MKKLFLAIVAIAMVASLLLPVGAAKDAQFVQVQYAMDGAIKIDGVINSGEWDENTKLLLSGNEKSEYRMYKWTPGNVASDIQFYYSWNNHGLYMAAKVIDATFVGNVETTHDVTISDRFQIFLNPGGYIADEYQGLVFSFCPQYYNPSTEANGGVKVVRHNWYQSTADEAQRIDDVDTDVKAKHTRNDTGWNMEAFLPWEWIASTDRKYHIDSEDPSPEKYLNNFDPNTSDRSLAYLDAMIAYVDVEPDTEDKVSGSVNSVIATGRTCIDGSAKGDFSCGTYGLILKLNQPNQAIDTDVATVAPNDEDTTPVEETGVDTNDVTGEVAGTEAPTTEDAQTGAEGTTNEAVTGEDSAEDTAKETTAGGDDDKEGGFPIGLVIGIVAAVVVIAAVVVVVLKKKK